MLRAVNLKKSYGEGQQAVHAIGDVSFEIRADELICIVGPSGCGKTTLLKCMSGLLEPTAGEVWLGNDRSGAAGRAWRSCSRSTAVRSSRG